MSESLFNKVAGLQACNFMKKRLQHSCFPVNTAKFLKTPILKNICERLLLFVCGIYIHIIFEFSFKSGAFLFLNFSIYIWSKEETFRHLWLGLRILRINFIKYRNDENWIMWLSSLSMFNGPVLAFQWPSVGIHLNQS